MKSDAPADPTQVASEIATLVSQLQDIEQRLKALTAGEVDAVIGPSGQSYLLQEAQLQLLQREQALRQSQSLLSMASRLGKIGAWTMDLATQVVGWSDEVCAIHEVPAGTSPTFEQALGFYAPEWRDIITRACTACIDHGTPFDLEVEILTSRGRRVWARAMGEAVRNGNHPLLRIQGAFQDLTDHKKVQETARLLAARLTHALESLTIGFLSLDRNWRCIYVNGEAERMLRGNRGDLIGRTLWEALPQLHGSQLENLLRQATSDQQACRDEFQLPAGTAWFRASAYPSEEGITIHLRDVSVEREDNEQLRLLQAGVSQISDMIVITAAGPIDPPGPPTLFVNDAFVRTTGFQREEILGKAPTMLYGPQTDLNEVAHLRSALLQGQPARAQQVMYRKNGEPYWGEIEMVPVRMQGVRVSHFVAVLRDISERKRDQDALQQLNADLESRVHLRTAELEVARGEAEEANRAKSAFLATMSHEIRTPMNGVIGLLDLLHQSSLQPNQAGMVDLIRESADTLLRIIDDILDFSKIEAGKFLLEYAPLPFADVVERVCGLMDSMAIARDVGLTVFVSPEIPEVVSGDETRVRQILGNLISNAIKFSSGRERPGRVAVRATVAERRGESAIFEVTVADNGIGMDRETLARLFSPFTQADASTTRRFGGTGLGLAITSMLVRLMSGRLSVKSEPLRGTIFSLRLPFQVVATATTQGADAALIRGLHCRLVGGTRRMADDLLSCLEHAGVIVERFPDLPSAVIRHQSGSRGSWLWLILPDQRVNSPQGMRTLVRDESGQESRFLVLGRGKRRQLRSDDANQFSLDIEALSRKGLFRALAIAAGRATHETFADAAQANAGTAPGSNAGHWPKLPACRILVAEDNATNRAVIRQQLELIGLEVELAEDGRQALEQWRNGGFAMLLTDLRMPELDGYALAAAIRHEEPAGQRMPIIALTANALPEERVRCLEAGMDDYLVKPVRLPRLTEVIGNWLQSSSPLDSVPDASRNPTPQDQPADLDFLKSLIGDDKEGINAVLKTFRLTSAQATAEMQDAIAGGDTHGVVDPAHKLKSGALSVGARGLANLCIELEAAGEAGQVNSLKALLPRFLAEMRAVSAYIAQYET